MNAVPSPDRQPHLRVHSILIFVSDVASSLEFYVGRLQFKVMFDHRFAHGGRLVGIAPPYGDTALVLTSPEAGTEDHALIGKMRRIALVCDDIAGAFRGMSERGVPFKAAPDAIESFGRYAAFDDPDGNQFLLLEFDDLTRAMEAQRRADAERLEAERRAAYELEFATQVQARLFPQSRPASQVLDYAGVCIQARHVGGDYYDFLSLGPGRHRFIVADVSGKGMPAALLMANLQANLRSQSGIATDDPQRLLASVNQLFYESSVPSAYATLFLADFDEATGTLCYANCGHLAGLILRSSGELEQLPSTATVVGMFPSLVSESAQSRLDAGDILLMYTDGVTEAACDGDEEFGESRLMDALRRYGKESAQTILDSIVRDVQSFSASLQQDDITLLVAKRLQS